jgi:hypothetical protein
MGIEPTWPAWKAGALPLSYTRLYLYAAPRWGPSRSSQSPLAAPPDLGFYPPAPAGTWRFRANGAVVEGVGFEPT